MAVKAFQRNTPPLLLHIYDNRKHKIAMIFLEIENLIFRLIHKFIGIMYLT